MGCWNTTCAISNLPIHYGEEVVVFLLVQNHKFEDFVHNDCYFNPCYLPFYGTYNDYGAVENCYGIGLPVLLDRLKEKHIKVDGEDFNVEKLFDLEHDDSLYIKGLGGKEWKISHAQAKRSVFDYILENWENKEHYWEGERGNSKLLSYNYKFKDIEKQLEDGYNKLIVESTNAVSKTLNYSKHSRDYDNLGFQYLYEHSPFERLLTVDSIFYMERLDLLKEMLKGGFIDRFMMATRRAWIKPIGNGSQDTDDTPHRLLIQAMTTVLDKERADYEAENGPCEDDE